MQEHPRDRLDQLGIRELIVGQITQLITAHEDRHHPYELAKRISHDETLRRLVHDVLDVVIDNRHALIRIERKERTLMALSQAELDAFAALIADIDEKFNAANGPLIAELTAQRDAALAEDTVDQAEVDRLTALVDTAEADTLAAIQAAKDHVDTLGTTPEPTPTPEPAPEG